MHLWKYRAARANEILSATGGAAAATADYRSSEFDNGFLALDGHEPTSGERRNDDGWRRTRGTTKGERVREKDEGNKNCLYVLHKPCVCVCTTYHADRFKCGSRRVALPSDAAVPIVAPRTDYNIILYLRCCDIINIYSNVYRLSSPSEKQANSYRPLPRP